MAKKGQNPLEMREDFCYIVNREGRVSSRPFGGLRLQVLSGVNESRFSPDRKKQ